MNNESEALVAAGYDAVYAAVATAPTLWQIWLDHAVGADFPAAFSHISFATVGDLQALAEELRLGGGDLLVDIACGMGGPSLWMATQHDIGLVGVDASSVAVALATSRAESLGLAARCRFGVGTFTSTGLPDGVADAWLSLDALQYAPSKAAALREAARVLKPGGRLAFTAFEVLGERASDLPVLGDDPVDDYEPLLEAAGFTVETYRETPGWDERVTDTFGAFLDRAGELTREMGAEAYGALALEAGLTLERRPYRRRVVAVATRRTSA